MDITELKYYEAELEYIAYHDSLTGLYNRLYMYETIGTRLKKIEENTSRKIVDAMLFMDIDNLKFINDTLGHSFGDKFILEIAMRLLSLTNNNCELFRLNGDEFIFYIKNVSGKEEIESFASKVIDCFNQTLSIDGHVISASVSIGISLYPIDGKDVDTLLRFQIWPCIRLSKKEKTDIASLIH